MSDQRPALKLSLANITLSLSCLTMRLLNARSLELEEFLGEIPRYAILSHTWEEEEVLFADFQDIDAAKKKKGFEKRY